jgi:hypothetical protein
MPADQKYAAVFGVRGFQVLQPFDGHGDVFDGAFGPHPAQRELNQHQADVAQMRIHQRGLCLGVELRKAQRDVDSGHLAAWRWKTLDRPAQCAPKGHQRWEWQHGDELHHTHAEPSGP